MSCVSITTEVLSFFYTCFLSALTTDFGAVFVIVFCLLLTLCILSFWFWFVWHVGVFKKRIYACMIETNQIRSLHRMRSMIDSIESNNNFFAKSFSRRFIILCNRGRNEMIDDLFILFSLCSCACWDAQRTKYEKKKKNTVNIEIIWYQTNLSIEIKYLVHVRVKLVHYFRFDNVNNFFLPFSSSFFKWDR